MRRLCVFNNVSLDGYFSGPGGDFSWAHGAPDAEFDGFVAGNASGDGELWFGRVTYEMMASFWPTPAAIESMPEVAAGMNRMRKVVFSRTLDEVSWNNAALAKGDLLAEARKRKKAAGPDIVILGSGSIVAQLAGAGLIDEYQVVVNPVALGGGRTMFDGAGKRIDLRLTKSRTFPNGKVFLCYEPRG
jgi:dihydrofolate reductase